MTTAAGLATKETARAGLGTAGGALSERECSIAYFGASVTVQKEGYRPRLHELLQRRFGQEHRSIVAAVGAIGIFSAVFLMDDLVIRREPELCLIDYTTAEFARHRPLDTAEEALDGALAKLEAAGIASCVIHLPRRTWNERADEVLDRFERVADRRGVPTIDLARPTWRAIDDGTLDPAAVFKDVVHTTPAGSELIAGAIDSAIGRLAAVPGHEPSGHPATASFSRAHVVPAAIGDAGGAGRMETFRLIVPYLKIDGESAIRRTFDGRLAGLVVLAGPQSGEIEVTDATGSQRALIWDEDCSYERYMTVELDRECPAGAEVAIALTQTAPDYSVCRRPVEAPEHRDLRVVGYMVLPA
jgi:hypothetical protein